MKHSTNQALKVLKRHASLAIALAGVATFVAWLSYSPIRFAPTVFAFENISLNCDQPVTATIDPATDTDFLSFPATDGERVEITIVKTSSGPSFQPFWRLLRNDGAPAGSCGSSTLSPQGDCGPLSSIFSPYRIEVQDFYRNATGTYRAHLYRLPATTACENISLTCGVPVAATINDPLDSDLFSFNAGANEFARITVVTSAPYGSNFQPGWRLLASNGNPANSCGFFTTSAQVTCGPLPAAGSPYRVEVQDFNRDDTGAYFVTVNFTVAACPSPAITLAPSQLNVVAGRSGNLTVTINQARSTPTTITLTSANPAIASVPNTTTIPANATAASFPVTGVAPGGPVTITAALPADLGGATATANVTVGPVTPTAQIEIIPPNPTTENNISVRISGTWPNSCTPQNPQVSRIGNEISIATSNPGQFCLQVLTDWSHTVNIGQLAARTYTVVVTHTTPNTTLELGRRSFTVTTPPFIQRIVRVVNTNANPNNPVDVPITLDAQGNENAIGFSLSFNPAILSNPQVTLGSDAANALLTVNDAQVTQGRLGVLLALEAGRRFTAGVRQIAIVRFAVGATSATSTTINPTDQPIICQASDVNANSLPVSCVSGVVTISQGLEADVAPRTGGNGAVTIADCVQVGRFVAGLDTPSTGAGGEFQRADNAPRDTRGDGHLAITDWVQSCRYAAALDPAQPAGGPIVPVTSTSLAALTKNVFVSGEASTLRAINAGIDREGASWLNIALDAQGNENAVGFSLIFDPTAWQFVSATAGGDAAEAMINVNADRSAHGRIGIALSLSAGQTLIVGARELVRLRFVPISRGASAIAVAFDDHPVAREAADANANQLQLRYASGARELRTATIVSAASFNEAPLAAESIATAFGVGLATATQAADTFPLPVELAGTKVVVRDSAGVDRLAPLFFVSPTQINYQVPEGTAVGPATVIITRRDGGVAIGATRIADVSPALFTANSSGDGVATALVLRIRPDGSQQYEPVAVFDPLQNQFVAVPIEMGDENDQVFLVLFGTGVRHRSALSEVRAQIGGVDAEIVYAGPQGGFAGLDQVNLRVPRKLADRGEAEISVNVDGVAANVVQVNIR
jgi:uncharacterized protein (TIGR03437 family)